MVMATAKRFIGIPDFELCLNGARMTVDGFDSEGDLSVDRPNEPAAVIAVQQALADLTYAIEVTGVYDAQTAATIRQFKIDQLLPVPQGMDRHDGVTGPGTSRRLDQLFSGESDVPQVEDLELRYTDRKSHYTTIALSKTNSGARVDWVPELGFAVNRPQIIDVYNYYRDLYLARTGLFLWAGLGRMAGGTVVGGLDSDPGLIDQVIMVRIGRDIFFDLAWMHEAVLDRPDIVIELAELHDRFNTYPRYDEVGVVRYQPGTPARSYAQAWTKILSGDPSQVVAGNLDLLENEQWSIIQPHYDWLRRVAFAGLPTPFANSIHPYHRGVRC